ncbi:MAG: hypothetical protein COA58_06780 [Bacteroidetes bacterium]|nr:MAG: hypothetical protein COA58_06780 [Bacteroidota bacterium]
MKLKIVLLTLAFFFFNQVMAQTTVTSVISSNQVWNSAGSPYLINQNTLIDSGVSVVVMPGTEIIGGSVNPTLLIDGEFRVMGTASSIVEISNLKMDYSAVSLDYDANSGTGAYMQFADIQGSGLGADRSISLKTTDFYITNCKLTGAYYAIYSYSSGSTDTNTLTIDSCDIQGLGSSGTLVYVSPTTTTCIVSNSNFSNGRAVFLRGIVDVFKCNFYDLQDIEIRVNADVSMRCNTFLNISNGIEVELYNRTAGVSFVFEGNLLDSFTARTSASAMLLLRYSTAFIHPAISINNNNFLNGPRKIVISGNNPNTARFEALDFTSNYWGTTNSADIDTMITDYNDDITIYGMANYTGFLSDTATSDCSESDSCPTPNLGYSFDGMTITFTDSNYRGGYIVWNYGDGTAADTVYSGTVVHTYDSTGYYEACMYVYNNLGQVCDSQCVQFSLNEGFGCQASYYVAVDTSNPFNLYIVNNSTGTTTNTSFSWVFGDGNSSTSATPRHTYDSFGYYWLCLTITDSATSCSSTFCDTIGMDSNGVFFKKEGFTLQVLDQRDLISVQEIEQRLDVSVYPNPSTGKFSVKLNLNKASLTKLTVINSLGVEVLSSNELTSAGSNTLNVDLSEQSNGMYFVKVAVGTKVKTYKVSINK